MTQTFRRLDNRHGGGHNRAAVVAYLKNEVDPLLRHGRGNQQVMRDLFCAAAEAHQLVGWMAYDVGQEHEGRDYHRHAVRLAQHAGDNALAAEMLAGMSHHAAFFRSAEVAIDLALAAHQAARPAGLPTLLSEVAVLEAHGLAIQGDKRASLAALGRAERAFEISRNGTDKPAWLAYFDGAYLAAKFAHFSRPWSPWRGRALRPTFA